MGFAAHYVDPNASHFAKPGNIRRNHLSENESYCKLIIMKV